MRREVGQSFCVLPVRFSARRDGLLQLLNERITVRSRLPREVGGGQVWHSMREQLGAHLVLTVD